MCLSIGRFTGFWDASTHVGQVIPVKKGWIRGLTADATRTKEQLTGLYLRMRRHYQEEGFPSNFSAMESKDSLIMGCKSGVDRQLLRAPLEIGQANMIRQEQNHMKKNWDG